MKFKLFSLIITLGLILITSSALAVTNISASPANIQVEEGESFAISIIPDPGEKIFTMKTNISYSPNLLELTSFEFTNNGWIPLSQPGYDKIDNNNGVLIKTAGYPGGLSSRTGFGTITFKALSSGDTTISFGEESMVLNSNGDEVIGNTNNVSVAITIPEPVQTTEEEPTPTSEIEEEEIVGTPEETAPAEVTEESIEETPEQPPKISSITLIAATVLTLGTGSNIISVFTLLTILIGVVFVYDKFVREPNK